MNSSERVSTTRFTNHRGRRRRISQALNRLIAGGQEYCCGRCAKRLESTYEINHIVSFASGGDSRPFNLVAICTSCHAWFTQNQARWQALARRVAPEGIILCEGCHSFISPFFRPSHAVGCSREFTFKQFPVRAPPSHFLGDFMSATQAKIEAARQAAAAAKAAPLLRPKRSRPLDEPVAPLVKRQRVERRPGIPMLRYKWPSDLHAQLRASIQWPAEKAGAEVERLGAFLRAANLPPPYFTVAEFDNDAEVRAFVHTSFARLVAHVPSFTHDGDGPPTWRCRAADKAAELAVPVLGDIQQAYEDRELRHCSNLSSCFTGDIRWEATAATAKCGCSPASFWRRSPDVILRRRVAFQRTASPSTQLASANTISLHGLFKEMNYTVAECTTFRPAVAKWMALPWGTEKAAPVRSILDPCGGWGDRLLGFAAAGVGRVVVNDPNAALLDRYRAIAAEVAPEMEIETVGEAFEDIPMLWEARTHPVNVGAPYDRVATCPPFFTREVYSTDAKQSSSKFPRLSAWLDGFLVPLHLRAAARLRVGGYMMIAVADYGPLNAMQGACFTGDMVRRVWTRSKGALVLEGVVRYSLVGTDVETGKKVSKHKPQPIFVWRKCAALPCEVAARTTPTQST